MNIKSGEVALVDLGTPPYGHEQSGMRPAVILSHTEGMVVVIPLTSNMRAQRFSATCVISPSTTSGIALQSIALVFHIRSIDLRRIVKVIGSLGTKDVRTLNALIRSITYIK